MFWAASFCSSPADGCTNMKTATLVSLLLAALFLVVLLVQDETDNDTADVTTSGPATPSSTRPQVVLDAPDEDRSRDRTEAGEAVGTEEETSGEVPTKEPAVVVRSSLGVRLPYVVIESEAGWRRVEPMNDRVTVPQDDLPARAWSPGHPEQVLAVVGSEEATVFLRPDSVLRVTGDNVSESVRSVELFSPYSLTDATLAEKEKTCVSWGHVDGSLVFAIDTAMRLGFGRPPFFGFKLRLVDDTEVVLEHDLAAGRTDSWQLPTRNAALKPVEVRLAGAEEGEELRVQLWTAGREDPATHTEYEWGNATVSAPSGVLRQEITTSNGRANFDDLTLQKRYGVAVTSSHGSWFGRGFFVHTGAMVEVELERGGALRGVLQSANNEPARSASFALSFVETPEGAGPDRANGWSSRLKDMPLVDGAFRLGLPVRVPGLETIEFPPPPLLWISILVAGHEPVELVFPWAPGEELDLGTIALEANPDVQEIQVDALVPVPPEGRWAFVLADAGASCTVMYRVAEVAAGVPGSTVLVLGAAADNDGELAGFELGTGELIAWPEHPPEHLLFQEYGEHPIPLVRTAAGPYELVPVRTHRVDIVCAALPEGLPSVFVGWSWMGVDLVLGEYSRESLASGRQAVELVCPEGAEMWWSATECGPTEDSVYRRVDPSLVEYRVP